MSCEKLVASAAVEPAVDAMAFRDPVFSTSVHSDMHWQELLGTSGFTAARFESCRQVALNALRGLPLAELELLLSDHREALLQRLAAGELLGLLGDNRLAPFNPVMCDLPAAEVAIGLDESEVLRVAQKYVTLGLDASWIRKEVPRHTVAIKPFKIGRFPVTNMDYRLFLLESGANLLPASWPLGRFPSEKANHPVHGISPQAADAYVEWLANVSGRAFRLPTEAEWEYAASGTDGREFPWGNEFDPLKANTAELGLLNTTPVGAFPDGAAPCGALDMAGNVEEFVRDAYHPYKEGPLIKDDLYLLDPHYRITRGGSFARYRDLARTRRRHGANHRSSVYIMGFRLAEDLS